METGLLQLLGVLVFSLPIDVAPPVGSLVGLSVALLAILCFLVVGIGLVAFFVIRAIKKNQASKNQPTNQSLS